MQKLVFLIGYMGCGKTTVGKKLSKKLNYDFIDTDDAITGMTGKSVTEIFEQDGENAFRQLEHSVLNSLSKRNYLVVSTGGGTPCFFDNMSLMNASGITVYLQMHPKSLAQRLTDSQIIRPLLQGVSKEELPDEIANHLAQRERFYNRAKIIMKGENLNFDKMVEFIKNHKN